MRKLLYFLVFSLILTPAACVPTLEPAPKTDATVTAQLPALPADEKLPPHVHSFQLENGLRLIVHESHINKLVTIDTWVGTGSANETAENNGVSHFLEHLLFKGTERFGPRELDRRLEALGAEINAATGDDTTHYYITVASRHFEAALEMHADMLLHALIPPAELDHERKVVIEEINRANDSPQRKLYTAMQELLYKKHPYRMDTLGPPENIATISRENILAYYHHWYTPGNMTVVVAGDVSPQKVRELVAKYFDGARPRSIPVAERPEEPPMEGPQAVTVEDENTKQAYLAMAWHGTAASALSDAAALDVAALVLGQGNSSRLHQRLVEHEHLALSVSAVSYNQRDSGAFFISAICEPQNIEKVKAIILEEVTRLSRVPVSQEELEKAVLSLDRDFVFNAETTSGLASLYGYYATIANLLDVFKYRSGLSGIDPARVLEAVRRYLRTDRMATVRLVPQGTDLTKSETITPTAPPPVEDVTPPLPSIVRSELPDGVTLIVKVNPGTDVVALNGMLRGGARMAPKPGIADLTARLAMKGTSIRSADALAKEIENAGLSLGVKTDEDYVSLTGQGLKGDLPHLLLLMRDVFYNATFPEEELRKERDRMLQEIKLARERPSSVAFEEARLILFPKHPYGAVGKRIEEALPSIKREDLVAYYGEQFRPERMVLTVVGDLRPAEVTAMVSELFAPRNTPSRNLLKAPAQQTPPAASKVLRTPQNTAQTWVVDAYLVPGITSDDYPALKLLSTVLGQGLSSRLFTNLREKRGLAYTTSAAFESQVDPSGFYLYIGTDPVNTRAVQEGFDTELARLRDELVGQTELDEAKKKFVGAFDQGHETNSAQAFYLSFYEVAGRGFTFDQTYPEQIEAVTSEDIRRVAQKYLNGPRIRSIVGPADKIAADATLPSLADIPMVQDGTTPERPLDQ